MLFTAEKSANDQQESGNIRKSKLNFVTGSLQVNQAFQAILDEADHARCEQVTPADNNSAIEFKKHKSWFKRKKLADFYPLSQEDADLLRTKYNRNLDFINKLLLKLAGEYSNHHFGHKKVLLNYMAKALAHELRETNTANNATFQFKSSDVNKAKERYLDKIEGITDTSKQAQLKRKIIGAFDSDTCL
ncbi:MAG: hypothetical protein MRQ09_03520 [Candidatus Midichloria sp.]|nr:hypothetical protein [Candidatus Midichloria sp.]